MVKPAWVDRFIQIPVFRASIAFGAWKVITFSIKSYHRKPHSPLRKSAYKTDQTHTIISYLNQDNPCKWSFFHQGNVFKYESEVTFSLQPSGCFKAQLVGVHCVTRWSGRVKQISPPKNARYADLNTQNLQASKVITVDVMWKMHERTRSKLTWLIRWFKWTNIGGFLSYCNWLLAGKGLLWLNNKNLQKNNTFCIIYCLFTFHYKEVKAQSGREYQCKSSGLALHRYKKPLHPLVGATEKHAAHCNFKGILTKLLEASRISLLILSYPSLAAWGRPKCCTYANQSHCYETNLLQ